MDLVQSVHRILLPGFREGKFAIDDPDQLVALALTVIRRKVSDNCRRLGRMPSAASEDLAERLATTDPADDPQRMASIRDAAAMALAQLSDTDRAVVELRLQGCEAAEIAKRIGSDAHAVRARLSRIRSKLRAAGCDEWL
jgi:RNA polymerase sigma factor (sigma-70 family)